jgi:hypothetical protein
MNDDLTLLASAYLDGDVTAGERARVEADPDVLAEVERLRYVRVLLADTEPSPISVRESLLAHALDAWDRIPNAQRTGASRDATPRTLRRGVDPATAAAAASITAPTSLADRRRATTNRRLLGAAAAIVLILAGGIVLQTVSFGSDDDSVSQTAGDATNPTDVGALESADGAEAVTAADEASPSAQIPAAAASGPDDGAQLDTGIDNAAPPTETDLEQLSTPEELAIFASDAIGAPRDPDVPAATSAPIDDRLTDSQQAILELEWPLCLGADYVVGPARYGTTDVVVGVDESRELALAYEAEDCREVARARLP